MDYKLIFYTKPKYIKILVLVNILAAAVISGPPTYVS